MLDEEKCYRHALRSDNIKALRETEFLQEFFMTMLPKCEDDFRNYKEDGDEKPSKNIPSSGRRARASELKQTLLQRLLTDIQYTKAVDPGAAFTAMHADLSWF